MSFNDKVALVTGSSSGIGAAIAVAFAKEGANVVLVGRNETKLAAVEQTCASHGKPPLVVKADVTRDDDANRIIQATLDKYGKLDILVNNAGIIRPGTILDGKMMQTFDEVVGVNLRAPMQLTTLAAPHLIKAKGNIVNISDIGGLYHPIVSYLAGCGVKAALNNFTLGSALELSSHGIRVNAVSPGPVYTDILTDTSYSWDYFKQFTALNRISEPEEIADLVLFLASDKAKGITGSNFVSDNGMMLTHWNKTS